MSLRVRKSYRYQLLSEGRVAALAVIFIVAVSMFALTRNAHDMAGAAVDTAFVFDNPGAIYFNPSDATRYTGHVLSGGVKQAKADIFNADKTKDLRVGMPCAYSWKSADVSCRVASQDVYNEKLSAEGEYFVRMQVTSTQGDDATVWKKIVVDRTAPAITGVSPVTLNDPTALTVFAASIGYGVSGLGSMSMRLYDSVTGGEVNVGSMPCSWQTASCQVTSGIELLKPGRDYFVVTFARDAAGNQASARTHDIHMSPSPPVMTSIVEGTNGQNVANAYTSSYDVTARWTAVAEASSYEYGYWNDISSSPYKPGSEYIAPLPVSALSSYGVFNQGEGKHFLAVRSVAANGLRSAWASAWVVYDKTAPVVSIVEPPAGVPVSGVVDIVGKVTDANPMNSYFLITGPNNFSVDNLSTLGLNEHVFSWDTYKVPDGTYTVQFEARDKAHNKSASLSVTRISVNVVNHVATPTASVTPPPATPVATGGSSLGVTTTAPQTTTPASTIPPSPSRLVAHPALPVATAASVVSEESHPDVLGSTTTKTPVQAASTTGEALGADDVSATDSTCSTLFGLCWYWWIPIGIAVVAIIWLLAYIGRNEKPAKTA